MDGCFFWYQLTWIDPDKEHCHSCLMYSTWLEVVQRDCQVRGLSKDDAMVRGRWRKMIRMVDEQEGCEWMDVSSGPGSPG